MAQRASIFRRELESSWLGIKSGVDTQLLQGRFTVVAGRQRFGCKSQGDVIWMGHSRSKLFKSMESFSSSVNGNILDSGDKGQRGQVSSVFRRQRVKELRACSALVIDSH
jgi:hypothetical protein